VRHIPVLNPPRLASAREAIINRSFFPICACPSPQVLRSLRFPSNLLLCAFSSLRERGFGFIFIFILPLLNSHVDYLCTLQYPRLRGSRRIGGVPSCCTNVPPFRPEPRRFHYTRLASFADARLESGEKRSQRSIKSQFQRKYKPR